MPPATRDYYAILGVPRDADEDAIRTTARDAGARLWSLVGAQG